MRIGCDLDNVIVDTMAGAKSALARDHGLAENEIIETLIYWQPYSHSEASIAQKLVTPLEFWDREDVLLGAPPVPGSLEAAWRMHDAGILACYITRRPPHVAQLTKRWLTENGFPDLPVEHVGNRNAEQYFAICKSTICQRYNVTHMIDDLADEAITLRNAGIEILLINAPIGRAARDTFLHDNPDVRVFDNALAAAEFALASPLMAAAGR